MAYERVTDPLAPTHVFIGRIIGHALVAGAFIAASLAGGMWGYMTLEGRSCIDAFVSAAMILSGMGPLGDLETYNGKLFAGLYALYSGLFVIVAAGIILAPVAHRILHGLHADDD